MWHPLPHGYGEEPLPPVLNTRWWGLRPQGAETTTIITRVTSLHIMPTLQEKALLVKLFYLNQQNSVAAVNVFRRMNQILRGRGRKQIPSSSVEDVATAVVEASSQSRHEQVKKNYHIQRYEFSQQQQLLFTGTSSCSAPATIPQDPDRSHPHILCLQQQQQTIKLPELKVSSITNVPLPGIRPLSGAMGPKNYLFTESAVIK
ncbi:hypothetical protein AVEN_154166-1 [Araneus ventricosus]|uniref:DUF4817 domain-containing protein n=1 Tax=Araneus ventricosus TaxID=182803 RepID=A0A4Y2GG64_ARAVE|nr:hypothetical protein AVEN_154166-1 [Araneus ventricosus]